jgi:Tat protein secretion system quality control protein TatD with DNase activity
MNRFSQFDIKQTSRSFEGDKVKMERILNREIVIHAFKIEETKVKTFQERGSGKCLHIQISYNNEMHVLFTSASGLIETIQQVPEDKFPFITIIINENERFKFT